MLRVPLQSSFAPHPLALLAAAFAAGILIAHFISLPVSILLVSCAICALPVFYLLSRQQHAGLLCTLLLLIAFLCAGATLAVLEKRSVAANRVERFYESGQIASGDPVELTGVLERMPEAAPDGFYLTLRVEKLRFKEQEQDASGAVQLFAVVEDEARRREYEELELRYGARVRVMAALEREQRFRNPGVAQFTEYLERRGFDATATIKSPLLLERLDDERVFLPLASLYEWRARLVTLIAKEFSTETAGVLDAALLGNRNYLSRDTSERFREGGTFHVLVISGLHISFIGGLFMLLARLVTKRRAWQFFVSCAFLWAYTIAVGAEASVVRAALMFTVVALAPVLSRRASSVNALGGAVIALLVLRPGNLFDPSFQLTFLSVLMIVALAWPLVQKMREIGEWHPAHETPYPPLCSRWFQTLCEVLFWSERRWRSEMARSAWSYKLFKTPIAARLERLRVQSLLRYAFVAMTVSVSVQLGLLPLLVLYFHRLSFASLILNICVSALMAGLSLVALFALAVSQLSQTLAAPLIQLAEKLNWLMVHSVDLFQRAGIASVRLPHYTGWLSFVYVLYYLPLALLILALARWRPLRREPQSIDDRHAFKILKPQRVALAFAGLFLIILLHPLSAGKADGRLHLDFLDVGQGDSALLTMPDGTTLLIDGGGRPLYAQRKRSDGEETDSVPFERDTRSIGEAVVSEYLWWRGLDHVDYILATHADADHIDGLNAVARNFKVRAAFVARAPAKDAEFARFAATAQSRHVPLYIVGRGDEFDFGGVKADVLWPPFTESTDAPSRNNESIVLRLKFGERVFLLTGDVEKEAEENLVSAQDELKCDLVKVAHHGSRTSSTQAFVNAARPALAIISVGLNSPFGHPHTEVLERWRATGAQILTTGQSGTISISTDGRDLKAVTSDKQKP